MNKYLLIFCLCLFGCGESQTIELSERQIKIHGKNLSTEELIALNTQALIAFSNEQLLRAQAQELQRIQIENRFYLGLFGLFVGCLGLLLSSSLYLFKKGE